MMVSIILIVSGLGLRMIGVAPDPGEIARIGVFFVVSIIYVAFWLGLALLFSILFRRTTTSALASLAIWIFFAFFMFMIAGVIADRAVPIDPQSSTELVLKHEQVRDMVMRISPTTLFEEATIIILNPGVRTLGPILLEEIKGLIPTPLPLGQSLLIIWPHLVSLIALTSICFAISYAKFMRQEIRPT
jgi:ABC-2 type transport system permease protein